jgi:hypothetical protein
MKRTTGICKGEACATKISQLTEFDISGHAQEDIVAFDITMDDTVLVQVLQTLARLPRYGGDLTFCHQIGGDDIRERASFHVFHDHPKVVLVQERVDVIDDIGMS